MCAGASGSALLKRQSTVMHVYAVMGVPEEEDVN